MLWRRRHATDTALGHVVDVVENAGAMKASFHSERIQIAVRQQLCGGAIDAVFCRRFRVLGVGGTGIQALKLLADLGDACRRPHYQSAVCYQRWLGLRLQTVGPYQTSRVRSRTRIRQ